MGRALREGRPLGLPSARRAGVAAGRALDRLSAGLDGAARWGAALLVAVMSTALLAQVLFRFVLERPLSWSEELARYSFVWLSLLGASSALRAGLHPGMDLLVARLPDRARRVACLLANLATGWLLWLLLDQGLALARLNMRQLSPAMRIPMGIPYGAIPAASFIMLVHLAASLLRPARPPSLPEGGTEGDSESGQGESPGGGEDGRHEGVGPA
ncbi:TRAP transporter small permease [Limnochorda pilosa]|uniref:C4-dicarboxylate ABC transporter permease n=1 Tax=Limnochorda pilosa TaxID=1555112 RepID=A0A0K2SIL7_LIMPI|nr:TRAP transporter small permease [Limnochorda pilosa]BAS26659.1 C4-dicarboxylate ABC transporter permease [Limnochorda pilosa]